jgi:Zn-dependent peptidase ImmA (M78 family)
MLENLQGNARAIERCGIRIRKFAGITPFVALDPYKLAERLGMKVVDISSLKEITIENAHKLLIEKSHEWSGASSGILPDGSVFIILNTTQSIWRRKATLMEEICHVLLGHQCDRLPLNQTQKRRDYDERQEFEAYGVGAAALVPYIALKHFHSQEYPNSQIAQLFGVSESLVKYRSIITDLS